MFLFNTNFFKFLKILWLVEVGKNSSSVQQEKLTLENVSDSIQVFEYLCWVHNILYSNKRMF